VYDIEQLSVLWRTVGVIFYFRVVNKNKDQLSVSNEKITGGTAGSFERRKTITIEKSNLSFYSWLFKL